MIGGLIVLSLLLTALAMVVFVSQQFSQYQTTVNSMSQYRNQRGLEKLVINSPGMIANLAWSGCSNCNMYNMSLSNPGSVGIQVVRIYINSTGPAGSGCSSPNPQPCILSPASATITYAFSEAQAFINPGELNHPLLLYLPIGVTLPNPTPAFPENTVVLVTARGNVFSFQWPFQPQTFGQTQSAFSSANMKVAYQGAFDSINEPGPVASGSGGKSEPSGTGYCHQETAKPYPAPAGYSEELTGMSSVGVGDSGDLWFLNPWITATSSSSTDVMASANGGKTTVYIYVIVVNSGNTAYSPTAGTIDMTWYGSNHIDGYLIGVYYNGQFYATSPSIPPGMSYYAIFKITMFWIGNWPTSSVMFWGGASLTDAPGSSAEGQSYFSGTILLSGLWIRYEATSGGCA